MFFFILRTELIPNEDLIEPNQFEIELSPEALEQLLGIQQDHLENMFEEEESSGE